MSANIPETKLVSELLKPTGFNCPENLEGKTLTYTPNASFPMGSTRIYKVLV